MCDVLQCHVIIRRTLTPLLRLRRLTGHGLHVSVRQKHLWTWVISCILNIVDLQINTESRRPCEGPRGHRCNVRWPLSRLGSIPCTTPLWITCEYSSAGIPQSETFTTLMTSDGVLCRLPWTHFVGSEDAGGFTDLDAVVVAIDGDEALRLPPQNSAYAIAICPRWVPLNSSKPCTSTW